MVSREYFKESGVRWTHRDDMTDPFVVTILAFILTVLAIPAAAITTTFEVVAAVVVAIPIMITPRVQIRRRTDLAKQLVRWGEGFGVIGRTTNTLQFPQEQQIQRAPAQGTRTRRWRTTVSLYHR